MASSKRSDGEGSIYHDATRDRWVGVLVVGWKDGKPVRRKVSAKTRADATRKLRVMRETHASGSLSTTRPPTVTEWCRYWLEHIAPGKVRPTTLTGYRRYVEGYIVPLLGDRRLDRLRPEHIEQAWTSLLRDGRPGGDGQPLSPTTALQAHHILSRALKVAHQRGIIRQNVATIVDAPAAVEHEVEPLTFDEARRVLASTTNPRWNVALALGLRQGEALALRWADVDLAAGVIRVRHSLARLPKKGLVIGPVKSRAGRRIVTITPRQVDALAAHRERQEDQRIAAGSRWAGLDLVFCTPDGSPIDHKADWSAWKALLEAAGVQHRRLHDARHTAATLLLAQGVAPRVVMEMLGHSQISVTSKYQHPVEEMKRTASERMESALYD